VITYEEALDLVNRQLAEWAKESVHEVVIVDTQTIERDFGWVFRYESKKAMETKDVRYALSGNGPIIVDRRTGGLRRFSSALTSKAAIREYEMELANGARVQ
jgi:hypothetical protein